MQKYQDLDNAFEQAPMAEFVKKLKVLGSYSYFALVIYYPVLFLLLDPVSNNLAYISLALFWLPMLFALKGLVKGNPFTYAWSNFVLMWCFLHGLTAIWTFEGPKVYIIIEVFLLTLAFIGNTYFARYRGRELGMALPKIKELKEAEKKQFEKEN